jgi:hypothetical protein
VLLQNLMYIVPEELGGGGARTLGHEEAARLRTPYASVEANGRVARTGFRAALTIGAGLREAVEGVAVRFVCSHWQGRVLLCYQPGSPPCPNCLQGRYKPAWNSGDIFELLVWHLE